MDEILDRPAPPAVPGIRRSVSIYQPKQQGLIFPTEPVFSTIAEERQHHKQRLVAACRAFAIEGFDYGFAGHLTVRDPEFPELYWTIHFNQVKMSNLILADHALRHSIFPQKRHSGARGAVCVSCRYGDAAS